MYCQHVLSFEHMTVFAIEFVSRVRTTAELLSFRFREEFAACAIVCEVLYCNEIDLIFCKIFEGGENLNFMQDRQPFVPAFINKSTLPNKLKYNLAVYCVHI